MKPKNAKTLAAAEAWRLGVELACELLDKSYDGLDEMALCGSEEHRAAEPRRPQHNLVWGYLQKLRRLNDERVEAAFGAALSDFIAMYACYDDADVLRELGKRPIKTRATTARAVSSRMRATRDAQREARDETKH